MSTELAVLDNVRAALKGEVRLNHKLEHVHLVINDDGSVTVEAEVPSIAVKKLALERIGAVPGVDGIVDRTAKSCPEQRTSTTYIGELMDILDDEVLDQLHGAEISIEKV